MYLNTELKMNGKNAFRRNYWPCVGATLVVSLLTGGGTSVASKMCRAWRRIHFRVQHLLQTTL